MDRICVVYWSGTGNTQAMAQAVAKGANAELVVAGKFDPQQLETLKAIAFGCPSMGAEQLEPDEFEPMFESCKSYLSGKQIVLFGSYGWGDGEWIRNWEEECRAAGAVLARDSVICQGAPDMEVLTECENLGAALRK